MVSFLYTQICETQIFIEDIDNIDSFIGKQKPILTFYSHLLIINSNQICLALHCHNLLPKSILDLP